MMDFLRELITLGTYAAAQPWTRYVWACALGVLVSVLVTQWVKWWWPLTWVTHTHDWRVRAVAFLLAGGTTALLVPTKEGYVLAGIVGLLSPFAYWLAAKRWPWITTIGRGL